MMLTIYNPPKFATVQAAIKEKEAKKAEKKAAKKTK